MLPVLPTRHQGQDPVNNNDQEENDTDTDQNPASHAGRPAIFG